MVVVSITSVLSGLAVVSWRRTGSQRAVDRWAGALRNVVMEASRRAIAAGSANGSSAYMVDLRASSVRWCQVDPSTVSGPPWTTTQTTCPSASTTIEESPIINAPSDAVTAFYAASADTATSGTTYAAAAKVAIGAGTALYVGKNGTTSTVYANVRGNAAPTAGFGFTAYARRYGSDENDKRRRVVVYGPSSKSRIISNY